VLDVRQIVHDMHLKIGSDKYCIDLTIPTKNPKNYVLIHISEYIQLMLEQLYPLSEQMDWINSMDKDFSISDTTYYKFLKEHLARPHSIHKKNMAFFAKKLEILQLIEKFPNQNEVQFKHLEPDINASLEDYKHFINRYYSPEFKTFLSKKDIKLELKIDNSDKTYLNVTIEEPAGNIASVVNDIKKEVAVAKPEDLKSAEKISSGNYSKVGQWKVYEKNEDRYVLKDKYNGYCIDLMPNSTVEELPKLWEIVTDRNEFPEEIRGDLSFLYGKYNRKTQGFDEDYIYFNDIDFIQYANPDTYGLVDRLLFIAHTAYTKGKLGYLLYRYYKGKIYFIENLVLPSPSATLTRAVNHWYENNITGDFSDFMKEL
jgi:hypothetical protein